MSLFGISNNTLAILREFRVDHERGFLPSADPLPEIPGAFGLWEEIAKNFPKLLASGRLRSFLEELPVLDVGALENEAEIERAMLILSYFGHGYVWGGSQPRYRIPAGIAAPWYETATRLGRPPVLSYASYALNNWRRIDPDRPISLGNIVLLQNFLGGMDEEWFILVHVDIEAKAAPALSAVVPLLEAVRAGLSSEVEKNLSTVAGALDRMYQTLLRMPEKCDPYIYYHRVRPYIHGWKDHPGLLEGIVYEGVSAYKDRPQAFRGETGAQSSIIPSLDALLGITHGDDPLRPYLREMRDYMPPAHNAFIKSIEEGPQVRKFVLEDPQNAGLRQAYNECLHQLERFRSKHLEYAAQYVQRQSLKSPYNPNERGTGGTPFLPYLKKHRDETSKHRIG